MLAITRKVGEAFRVGDAIVKITKTAGQTVRVSIEAPPSMLILREELVSHDPPQPLAQRFGLRMPQVAE